MNSRTRMQFIDISSAFNAIISQKLADAAAVQLVPGLPGQEITNSPYGQQQKGTTTLDDGAR